MIYSSKTDLQVLYLLTQLRLNRLEATNVHHSLMAALSIQLLYNWISDVRIIKTNISKTICCIIYSLVPHVEVDVLNYTIVKILPDSSNGYNCTPSIPNGEINELGELVFGTEANETATGEYTCSNQNNDGLFYIDLNDFGKLNFQ